MKVLEVMRVHVNTITADATLPDVLDIMDLYQTVCVPVVDSEGRPLGVVSEADVAGALLTPSVREARAAAPSADNGDTGEGAEPTCRARQLTVAEIMTAPAVCIEDQADVRDAVALLVDRGLKRLPVTTDGVVVGTVGRVDICQALLASSGNDAEA